ncbi:fasciclin-like arabinogalactan protein 2 [Typha latifolia]|uniref:fasciclin-like arabinogalactan protein 2 n=1 Tax=Typha latifolia TaxID=4733 RepID=UPI003C2EBFCB
MRPILLLILVFFLPSSSTAHNITRILAAHPDFSTFNHYLTETHLAHEINRRLTITVLALDNTAMGPLLSRHHTLPTLRHLLSLHVLVDYFGARKLHQLTGGSAVSSTLFQASGDAPDTAGFVNISLHRAGHVSFFPADSDPASASPSSFVKSVKEIPYNISIIQISSALSSPAAEAPAAAPAAVNLTDLMAKKGCKTFADLLLSTADAAKTFQDGVDGGLSVFCPIDQAMKAFAPKFKNLTAEGKLSLLLYHAIPVYYSIQMLKTDNGVVNTLATDGTSKNYNFTVQNDGEVVTLKTAAGKVARVTGTLKDDDPLAVYTIDEVLEPRELFKKAETPAPAPAPEVAEAPKAGKKGKHGKHASPPAPVPAGPDEQPADEKVADQNAGKRVNAATWAATAMAATIISVLVVG